MGRCRAERLAHTFAHSESASYLINPGAESAPPALTSRRPCPAAPPRPSWHRLPPPLTERPSRPRPARRDCERRVSRRPRPKDAVDRHGCHRSGPQDVRSSSPLRIWKRRAAARAEARLAPHPSHPPPLPPPALRLVWLLLLPLLRVHGLELQPEPRPLPQCQLTLTLTLTLTQPEPRPLPQCQPPPTPAAPARPIAQRLHPAPRAPPRTRTALAPHGAPSAHRHRPAAERFRPVCRRAALRAATTTSRRRPWSCGGWHSAANGRRSDRSERGPVGIQSGSSSARHIATLRPSLLASPFPPPRARPAPPPPPAAGDVVPHWGSCGLNYGGAPAAFVNSPSKGRRGRLRGRGHGRGRGRGRPGGGAEGRLGKALGSSGHKVATLA